MRSNKFLEIVSPLLVLLFVIIFYLNYHASVVSEFKQLPSPLYGGDYYYQLGHLEHVLSGGSLFDSQNIAGYPPSYFVLYTAFLTVYAKLLNLEALEAMLGFTNVALVLFFLSSFLCFYLVTRNVWFGILGSLLLFPATQFPVFKYTSFAFVFFAPLFYTALLLFVEYQSYARALLLGVITGLATWCYPIFYPLIIFSFAVLFCFEIFSVIKIEFHGEGIKIKKIKKINSRIFYFIFLAFFACFLCSLPYWFKPFFVYHMHTNGFDRYAWPNYGDVNYAINFLLTTLQRHFFNFDTVKSSVVTVLFLLFLFLSVKTKEISKRAIFLLALSFLTSFHYFITMPFGFHLFPAREVMFTFPFLISFLCIEGLSKISRFKRIVLIICFFTLLFANLLAFEERVKNDRWIEVGKTPLEEHLVEARAWIKNNTGVYDVFLSNNELSFALTALTGRKIVIFRRNHVPTFFLDFDTREIDAATILYSNNASLVRKLLKKYNISYLYWNYYWINSEFHLDENGRIVNIFDPLMVFDTQENRKLLEERKLRYVEIETWPDPAMRGKEYKKARMLLIIPNYRNFTHPWSETLDQFLELQWGYSRGNVSYAKIYKIAV